jgi:hypothetical protein
VNGEEPQRRDAEGGADEHFAELVRELLAEDAYTVRPSPAPYPAIRRRGVVERRRRAAAVGAALVALAVVPVGAYALGGPDGGAVRTTATRPTAGAGTAPATTPAPSPTGPAGPATPGQLLDGTTLEEAADGLAKCIAYDEENAKVRGAHTDLGTVDSYRIILAMNSTGDSNSPGDGRFIVAVKEEPQEIRLICQIKDGETAGLSTSVGDHRQPDSPPVMADINGGKLYQQSFLDKGNWKLPYRWGVIGTVEPSVAEVTVSYGGATDEAVLDDGWFVASGTLNRQVDAAPRIKGYDADGKLVYDSDQDRTYDKALP